MAAAVARVSVLRTRLRAERRPAARQLFAELFGLATRPRGGVGEPCGKGFLVVAGVKARRVTRVGDFDRGRDERAQRRVDVEGGEEAFAGVRSVLSNTSGRMSDRIGVGIRRSARLTGEVLVQRALGHPCHRAKLVYAGGVDALIAEQLLCSAHDPLSCAPAAAQALRPLSNFVIRPA